MKVFVAGATGRVARELIADLVAAGHDVIAAARRPENVTAALTAEEKAHVRPLAFDLHGTQAHLESALVDAKAVYFVAGSRGKDLLQTDAFGAVKLMRAAQATGVKRFIMLSSAHSLEPAAWEKNPDIQPLLNYTIAKFFADTYLITNTELNYTILQPTALIEEPGTGLIATSEASGPTNPIPDVAAVLAAVLEAPNTYRTVIPMGSGTTPIKTAVLKV